MIYECTIRKINGLDYISGCKLVSEKGTPSEPLQFSRKPYHGGLSDKNRKPQWTIRENPDYDPKVHHVDQRYIIEKVIIPLSDVEKQKYRKQKVVQNLMGEIAELIYDFRKTPEIVIEALCNRAKEIEQEVKHEQQS